MRLSSALYARKGTRPCKAKQSKAKRRAEQCSGYARLGTSNLFPNRIVDSARSNELHLSYLVRVITYVRTLIRPVIVFRYYLKKESTKRDIRNARVILSLLS